MFVLNLLFDLNEKTGLFSRNKGGPLLTRSDVWLKPDPDFVGLFDPENSDCWNIVGKAAEGTLLIPNPVGEEICVRIAAVPDTAPVPTDAKLDLVLAFGAPVRASQQQHSSPFTANGEESGLIRTTFQFNNRSMTTPANKAWFVKVGKLARHAKDANRVHRYEFALGAVIKTSTTEVHFGIDPEMDVGM